MKTIGILMGGYSGEYDVSIASGNVVYNSLVNQGFELFKVEIKESGWEALDATENRFPINKDDFSFEIGDRKVKFDAVFNAVHGNPGEDGPLAGYFDMLGLPYSSSGQFASALTFNKAECNILLDRYGFRVATSVFLHGEPNISEEEIIERLGLPCFVKPCRSGSSLGVSRVTKAEDLSAAIQKAKEIDHKVIIESAIPGLELACGVSDHSGEIKSLAITHIKPPGEYFDFESKYDGSTEEITPAHIDTETYELIMRETEEVYRLLELKGLARIDYILDENGKPVLIEVNTVPGFSEESLLPKQAVYAGIDLPTLFRSSIEKTLS